MSAKKTTEPGTFKRTVYGYDPQEVDEHIDCLESKALVQQRNFDNKYEEYKSTLTLITSERDFYKSSSESLSEQLAAFEIADVTNDTLLEERDYLAGENVTLKLIVEDLKQKLSAAEAAQAQAPGFSVAEEFLTELEVSEKPEVVLKSEYDAVVAECRAIQARLDEMAGYDENSTIAVAERNALLAENHELKSSNDEYQIKANEYQVKYAELNDKILELTKEAEIYCSQANDNFAAAEKAAENEYKVKMMTEQITKYEAEISELNETVRKQLYVFAQQRNEIETEFAKERLTLIKLLQVHAYHLKRSENLVKELNEQFHLAHDAFKEIKVD